MFAGLWPDVPVDEVPIASVTNGVHAPHVGRRPRWPTLLSRYVLPDWDEADGRATGRASTTSATTSCGGRASRAASGWSRFVRAAAAGDRPGRRASRVSDVGVDATSVLDPKVLTIGFARRFATYKRATLLLVAARAAARRCCCRADRPVQFVFAGKAHPADDAGKELIQQIVHVRRRPDVRHRFVFLDDYDMAVARALVPGRDVWLNNPRRPLEACGTSGMKAALNGALNCSILDGWWDECFDGDERLGDLVGRGRRPTSTGATSSRPTACSSCSSARSCRSSTTAPRARCPARWVAPGEVDRCARSARRSPPPHGARLRHRRSTSRPRRTPTSLDANEHAAAQGARGVEGAGQRGVAGRAARRRRVRRRCRGPRRGARQSRRRSTSAT